LRKGTTEEFQGDLIEINVKNHGEKSKLMEEK